MKQQDLKITMEDSLNFSKLTNFLHQTLVFTEEAKDVLKSNCDEAMYCLKPLYTEIYPQQEVNKDVCTCVKTKTEVEEIAAGISRALIQTQQLREKLSSNVTEKSPKCYNMYEYSQATGSKTQKNVKNLNLNNKNIYSKQNLYGIKSNIQKTNIDKVQSEIAQRDQLKKTKNNNKQLVTHPKLSGSKNFLAINKRNIKNIKEVKDKLKNNVKSNTSITKSKCIKFDERNSAASTSELKNLIQKMTVKSGDCTLSNECNIKCPLHENKISQYTCEQNLTVKTFVDCLNTTDIPEEIIKSLKVYHKFLNIEYTEKSFSGKQKELHTFLVEFNKMNEIVQKKFVHKNYIINALFKFISLFQYLFSKTMKIDLEDIRSLYTELSSPWKVYELKEFKNKQILKNDVFKTPHIVSNMKGYMSNGIWNSLYNKNLEEMSKIYCIRYTSKDQLLLFFDIIQQFQHIQYYNDLIKIIAEDILPNMNAFFDCTQSEYVKIYKMIFILYQGLNPKIPILVRTDK